MIDLLKQRDIGIQVMLEQITQIRGSDYLTVEDLGQQFEVVAGRVINLDELIKGQNQGKTDPEAARLVGEALQ